MRASIDGLTEKLLREVKTYKDKRRHEPRRRAESEKRADNNNNGQ